MLSWCIHMTHSKVLHDLMHVLVLEKSVIACLVFGERKKKIKYNKKRGHKTFSAIFTALLKGMQNEYAGIGLTLTVQANVVEGENNRSVSFGDSLHSTMDSAIWCLNIMLLYTKNHNENKAECIFTMHLRKLDILGLYRKHIIPQN